MFRERVGITKATDQLAEGFFASKVFGHYFDGDVTFISTLRCLLIDRLKGDDYIKLRMRNKNLASYGDYDKNYLDDIVPAIPYNGITILNVNGDESRVEKFFKTVDESLLTLQRFSCVEEAWKVKEFYKKQMPVRAFVSPRDKGAIIIVSNLTLKKWHYLQCACLLYMPWIFNPEKDTVSKEEMELLNSLKEKDPLRYMNAVDAILSARDFRTEEMMRQLSNFESYTLEQTLQNVKNEIERMLNEIKSYQSEINALLERKFAKEISLLGLQAKLNTGNDSELLQYFRDNENLLFVSARDGELTFIVKGYLTSYRMRIAEENIETNTLSNYFYAGELGGFSLNDKKMLLKAIFLEQKIKLRFCAAYHIRLGGGGGAFGGYNYPLECADSMPNPHTDIHQCMGAWGQSMNECLTKNDYVGAVEQCIYSCMNVNLDEYATMEPFFRNLWSGNKNNRCLELPDGRVVKPAEAIQWLKEENNGENNQSN